MMLGCIIMVDRLTCVQNQVRVLEKINQELDEELHNSLQKNTAQGIMISTHEVTISQQTIRIKKLEAQVKELQGWDFENIIDKIYGEQNLKSPKDIRIEELEAQLRELQDWDSADMPNGERIYNTGRGMIQYPFNPEGEELEDKLSKAQEVVEDNVQTILRLQMELRTADAEVDSLLEQNERLYSLIPNDTIAVSGEHPNTPQGCISSRGMVEYPFNPEGEEPYCMQCSGDEGYLDECICGIDDTPTPYPYTQPIREVPPYSRRQVK